QAILDDRRQRYLTGEYGYNAFAGESGELVTVPIEEVKEVFEKLKATIAPRLELRSTIASNESWIEYTLFPYVKRLVEVPVLMTVAEGDDVTWIDLETAAFNEIPSARKQLRTLPGGTTHTTLYRDRTPIEVSAGWASDWFEQHLIRDYA